MVFMMLVNVDEEGWLVVWSIFLNDLSQYIGDWYRWLMNVNDWLVVWNMAGL